MKWDAKAKELLYNTLHEWRWSGPCSPRADRKDHFVLCEFYEKFDITLNGSDSKKRVIIDSPFAYGERLQIPKETAEKFIVLGVP
jgi:hypothetical protein